MKVADYIELGGTAAKKELAEMLGVSLVSVYSKLKGESPWKLREVQTLARNLDMTPEEIMEEFFTKGE